MRPQYTGPLVVVSRNRGGAYILCDLDGTLTHSPFGAFCVVPYFTRNHIDIPDIEQHIDVTVARLRAMEDSTEPDPKDIDQIQAEEDIHTPTENADEPEENGD